MSVTEAKWWLRAAKQLDGTRRWRAHISQAWLDGDYERHGLKALAGGLQRIRNIYGPAWLIRVKGI